MDNWLKNTWAIRLVSLILAILLYVAVSISQDPDLEDRRITPSGTNQIERLNNVPVEILMDDDDDYVVSGVPETVVVGLDGPYGSVTPIIRQSTVEVYADLTGYDPGTYKVDLKYSGIPNDVEVYIEPGTVEVVIEERATAEFEVEVDYINQNGMPEGFEAGEATVEPEMVTITSSETEVDKVAAVKAYVDLQDVAESIDSREVPINAYDIHGNELNVNIEPQTVFVSVDISNPNKEVPIEATTTGELPEGLEIEAITVEPEEATVFAPESVLDGITELTTEEIDLSQITESTEMEVNINVPNNARRVTPERVQVSIELVQAEAATFEEVEVIAENVPENQTVTFTENETEAMDVTVTGKEEELNTITKEDIQLSIDLEEADTGEHVADVATEVPGDLVAEPEHEQVNVSLE